MHFYSSHSLFGYDNYNQYKQHLLQTNFHAKLMHSLNDDLKYHEHLDSHFQPHIKTQTKGLRSGKLPENPLMYREENLTILDEET